MTRRRISGGRGRAPVADPRTPVFELLRPHLKQGWNAPGLVEAFSRELDALGAAKAIEKLPDIQPRPAGQSLSFVQVQIDLQFLLLAFPQNNAAGLAPWVEPTRQACVRWGIDTHREVCSFLANISIESGGLTTLTESLNYSTEALIAKFGRHRISVADAQRYGRNKDHPADQQALANILYGGAWGAENLGNDQPGDGWRYRGYGPKQLTGKRNQAKFAAAIGIPVAEVPAYVRTPEGGMMSAGWFWKANDLDSKAATPGLADDRKAINGGAFGLPEVEKIFDLLIDELLKRERKAA